MSYDVARRRAVLFGEWIGGWNHRCLSDPLIYGSLAPATAQPFGTDCAGTAGLLSSQPQILLDFLQRVPEWCVLVALVGSGQAIHQSEEGGLPTRRRCAATFRVLLVQLPAPSIGACPHNDRHASRALNVAGRRMGRTERISSTAEDPMRAADDPSAHPSGLSPRRRSADRGVRRRPSTRPAASGSSLASG